MDWENFNSLDLPVVMDYDNRYEQSSWEELDELCSKGDPIALYETASKYRLGEGIEKDVDLAMQYYEKVLKYQKDTNALYYMGVICMDDLKSEDCERYFRLGSSLGNSGCSSALGELYRYGDYVEQNSEQAIYFFKLSAEQGETSSLVSAGEVCLDEENYDRALDFFNSAYQSDNNPLAAFYIGRMYYYGTGVEVSDDKAFQYLKVASDGDVKDANVMLASLYGFGDGTDKDVQLAMKLLDDVIEDEAAWAYNIKGRILIAEGNREEGKKCLQKSAELGNQDAQDLLNKGVGKTDEELANEGSDPYAMLRYSAKLMGNENGQKPDFIKSREIIYKANELYPDYLDVKKQYIRMLHMSGHIGYKIGAIEDAYEELRLCYNEILGLKRNNIDIDDIKYMEDDLYMDYGEAAYGVKDYDTALNMLSRVDWNKYPYAVVRLVFIHIDDIRRYSSDIVEDVRFLKGAVNSDNWRNKDELATAYYMLEGVYVTGIPNHLYPDVNYAYACIKKCEEIDPELAKDELRKFSKGLFGKISYRN